MSIGETLSSVFGIGVQHKPKQDVFCSPSVSIQANKITRISTFAFGFLFSLIGGLFLFFYLKGFPDDGIWSTDPNDDPETINQRQQDRGIVASLICSIIFGVLNFGVDYIFDTDPISSSIFFGLLMGSTLGFFLDNILGSEEGYSLLKEKVSDGVNYASGKMSTSSFCRFTVTVLLDTFISVVLFSQIYPLVWKYLLPCNPALANGLCSALIAMITFQAYSNQTRFLWAYPDPKSPKNTLVASTTIFLATAVAGTMFLSTQTQTPGSVAQGIHNPIIKLCMVIGVFVLMSSLFLMSQTDQTPETTMETSYVDKTEGSGPDDWRNHEKEICEESQTCRESFVQPVSDTSYLRTLMFENETLSPEDTINRGIYGKLIMTVIVTVCTVLTLRTANPNGNMQDWRVFAALLIIVPFCVWLWVI